MTPSRDCLVCVPKAEKRRGGGEKNRDCVHNCETAICQNNRRKGNVALPVQRLQALECPCVVRFRFAAEKCKGDAKRPLRGIDTDHIEEGHIVFVRLVGAVEKEDIGVGVKVVERLGMREKNRRDVAIWCMLYLAPEAFFVELGSERMNRALAFASVSTYFRNPVVDVLSGNQ